MCLTIRIVKVHKGFFALPTKWLLVLSWTLSMIQLSVSNRGAKYPLLAVVARLSHFIGKCLCSFVVKGRAPVRISGFQCSIQNLSVTILHHQEFFLSFVEMRILVSIALVLLVFSGSVGVPLYQHTCAHEQITIHTLFTGSDHCKAMEEAPVQPERHSCCAKPQPQKVQLKKETCCTEHVTRLALSFNFFEQVQSAGAILPDAPLAITRFLPYAPVFPTESQVLYASNSDPPPLSGRELLQSICILRL